MDPGFFQCCTIAGVEWYEDFSFYLPSTTFHPLESPFAVSSVLTLICSLPRVEDLDIQGTWEDDDDDDDDDDENATSEPPTLPPLIKSLLFSPAGGTERSAHQLLDLLNGICLRKFSSTWYYEKELPWIMKLIEACTGTLEHIKVMNDINETCGKLRSFSLRYGVNS